MNRIVPTALVFFFFISSSVLLAQKNDSLQVSGFAEVYYTKDQNSWGNHARPDFLYNHTASNYIALNSAVLSVDYKSERIKANISLVEGTYANRVTSQEKQGFGSLYSAYFTYLPFKNKKHEFRAGIFPSHIGLESAIGLQNICLSRSLAAENTPYYESGVSFTLKSKNEQWNASVLVLNGWQNMNKLAQENHPSFGTQITFQPNKNLLVNHSTFIGEVMSFDTLVNRYYQDFYIDYQLNTKWKIQALYDIGLQSHKNNTTNYTWQTAAIMLGYRLSDQLGLGGRLEVFKDPYHNIITYAASDLVGYSVNMNYSLRKNLLFRAEYRCLHTQNSSFQFETKQSSMINGVNLSLAVQF
jgi:Putative beta-barrel porin-2, OmpL-like. bbp2